MVTMTYFWPVSSNKKAKQNIKDKTWALSFDGLHEYHLYVKYKHISNYYFIPSQPVFVASNFLVKIIIDHKMVLVIALWTPNLKKTQFHEKSQLIFRAIKITLQH